MTLSQELDSLLKQATFIPDDKRYWLIRTDGGSLYESFSDFGVVALLHQNVSLSFISELRKKFANPNLETVAVTKLIRERILKQFAGEIGDYADGMRRQASLIASQTYKFLFEVKFGDTVVIPSANSDVVNFGTVTETYTAKLSGEEKRGLNFNSNLIKRVRWIKEVPRRQLDPLLYRMFTAHQAISDAGSYATVIERSIKNFFILNDEAHLILNIETESKISAGDLFKFGSELLEALDEFASQYSIEGVSSSDLSLTVNLNSPGKIDLKSKAKKTTLVLGIMVLLVGGKMQFNAFSLGSPGLPGIIKAISEFLDKKQEREARVLILQKYADSLVVKAPDDLNKLLKQHSENKDQSLASPQNSPMEDVKSDHGKDSSKLKTRK